jgi:hypothetical protein
LLNPQCPECGRDGELATLALNYRVPAVRAVRHLSQKHALSATKTSREQLANSAASAAIFIGLPGGTIAKVKSRELAMGDLAGSVGRDSAARPETLDGALISLCRRVEAVAPGSIAGLTLCNPARTHLERAIFPALPEFAAAITAIPLSPSDFGSCVYAVARGTIITCPDIAQEERFDPQWRRLCLDHGIRSLQSRPVYLRDRKPYATFVLVYREPREENEWNVALMTFAADAASLILQSDADRLNIAAE